MSNLTPIGPSRQLSAILFADVQGYTRSMSRDEEGTYNRVTRAIGLIRSLIGDYGGRVVHTAGDGVLALFDSTTQALSFAIEIQREFRNEAVWHPDDDALAFRMGINLGEVLMGDSDVHGHSVNVAARIQALARPGGICVTASVQRAVRDTLGLPMRSMGQQSLKNITEPVEVFAIEINGPTSVQVTELLPLDEVMQPPPTEASVAVLPLDNLSGDPRDNHLCDGFTGDIITNLSRFRDLLVIAQHSAFLFRNQNLPVDQIGRQLGVRYLLSGGLQRSGNKIRLQVQLAEAESGRLIWADRYNGDLGEVFAFQDDVTGVIAARLAIQISAAEHRRAVAHQSPDLHAYGLILRGQDLSFQFRKEANSFARRLFEQAAEIDPEYGRSYAAMSRTFNLDWRYSWTSSPEASLDRAVDCALSAINRDNLDARGHSSLGFAYLYKKQHDASLAAYQRAIELNPNDADIIAEFADALVYDGQPQESIELMQKAMRLNPYCPDWYLWYLADAHNALGHAEDVIATVKKMRNPGEGRRLLAANYAHLGMLEEAKMHAAEVMRLHPEFTISRWAQRPPHKNREFLEHYMEGLRKAGLPED